MDHYVVAVARDQVCGICARRGRQVAASHRVAEDLPAEHRKDFIYNAVEYLCCWHFLLVFGAGAAAFRGCAFNPYTLAQQTGWENQPPRGM